MYTVCVWLFVPLPPSIGPQQGGGWFTGWVDGWVGGGRWSWWSHHSGICAAEVKPHTVAPHPVYHCRYPLSSSTQTLLLPPNFKFIFPSKFTFVFLLMLQPAIKMVPFKICVKTYIRSLRFQHGSLQCLVGTAHVGAANILVVLVLFTANKSVHSTG